MSRPSPQSEPTDLARTLREICAHMLDDAAAAGLLAPLCLLIARAIAGLFGRLANIAELWQAGALPPPRAQILRTGKRPGRARPNCARPNFASRHACGLAAVRVIARRPFIAQPQFALARGGAAHTSASSASRPVERYPKH